MTYRSVLLTIAALTVLVISPCLGAAQSNDEVRTRWGGHAGLAVFGTGDDANCPDGSAVALGAEFRTGGVWLAALGAEAFGGIPQGCTQISTLASHEGESVSVHGSSFLYGAGRLRARLGRSFAVGEFRVEPALGGGGIYSQSYFLGDDDPWLWNAWFGASLDVHTSGIGVRLELGGHQVPTRYYSGGEVVHEFRRWKPFTSLSLVR